MSFGFLTFFWPCLKLIGRKNEIGLTTFFGFFTLKMFGLFSGL